MTWAKLDDQFHGHLKAKIAWRTPRALGMHLLAMSYCAGLVTDGLVDDMFIEEKLPAKAEREKTCGALVDAGLWDRVEGGYIIHDWLDYNPSKVQVEERRRKDRERKNGKDSARTPVGVLADSVGIPSGVRSEPPRGRAGGTRRAGAVEEPETINEKEEPQGSAIPDSFDEVMSIADDTMSKDHSILALDMAVLSTLQAHKDANHVRCAHEAAADLLSGRRSTRHFHVVLGDRCRDEEKANAGRAPLKAVPDRSKYDRAAGL